MGNLLLARLGSFCSECGLSACFGVCFNFFLARIFRLDFNVILATCM